MSEKEKEYCLKKERALGYIEGYRAAHIYIRFAVAVIGVIIVCALVFWDNYYR